MKPFKIMPDFCSSGIWDAKTGVMVDEEELKLPKSILSRLHHWINATYEKCHTKEYAGKKDPRVWNKMNLEGFAIACDIKRLHPDWVIYFAFEGPRSRVDVVIQEMCWFTGDVGHDPLRDGTTHHFIRNGKHGSSTFKVGL